MITTRKQAIEYATLCKCLSDKEMTEMADDILIAYVEAIRSENVNLMKRASSKKVRNKR